MWPTFIGVGPGRAGTTTIFHALAEHPQICMARHTKEVNFFNDNYDRGADWYRAFFAACDPHRARGEMSNTYFYDAMVPGRISRLIHDARLIVTLRNPFQRIVSAFRYGQNAGEIDSGLTIKEAIAQYPRLVKQNEYGNLLDNFLACFARSQLLVSFYDDLEADGMQYIQGIYTFIGVDAAYRPEAIFRRYNERLAPRSQLLTRLAHGLARLLRRMQLFNLLSKAKHSPRLEALFYRDPRPEMLALDEELYAYLAERFIPQIQAVEQQTGRDLSHWYARV